jgi:peptidoglycan-associated lipoprotein
MTRLARAAVLSIAAALAVAGCSRKPKTRPTPARINADSLLREQARQDSIQRAEAAARAAAAAPTVAANAGTPTNAPLSSSERTLVGAAIYFDLDESALTEESRTALEAKAPVLVRHPRSRIRITGHCDARGSVEYNHALGLRRAADTKRYLAALGVDESRIEIVTMGEERPAVQGNTEEAYALNRRAEFEVLTDG